jgi:predicted HD superfamily hydrolase involved in NAD metabolism
VTDGSQTGPLDAFLVWTHDRLARLTAWRRGHSERVAALARALAERHGIPTDDAYRAGLAHDLARELPPDALLAEARRLHLPVGPDEERAPILLHGPVAAAWLEEAGLGHDAIWEAIRYHTTAAAGLCPLARIVFIADGTEPARDYPEAAGLRDLAFHDLEAGYRAVLRQSAAYLTARGLPLHPWMQAALAEANGPGPRAAP